MFKNLFEFFLADAEERSEEPVQPVKSARKKKKRAPRRDFGELYPLEARLTLLRVDNPKRKGTGAYNRYGGYRDAYTVGGAIRSGLTYRDIDNDVKKNYIAVGDDLG